MLTTELLFLERKKLKCFSMILKTILSILRIFTFFKAACVLAFLPITFDIIQETFLQTCPLILLGRFSRNYLSIAVCMPARKAG